MECLGGIEVSVNDLFRKINIIPYLKKLDSLLVDRQRIVLAGSAVPILAGCDFRSTMDIDFALLPSEDIVRIVQNDKELSRVFDFNAQGIIGLLIDAEDRLVTVDIGCKNLEICRLSILDWVVSKLASPKLEDVLAIDEVDREMLEDIKSRMALYGGISYDRAINDLNYLIDQR